MKLDNLVAQYGDFCRNRYPGRYKTDTHDFVKGFAKWLEKNRYEPSESVKDIAVITEYNNHLTGGRYYTWWLALALKAAGFDVTIYTNQLPTFVDHFKDYKQPRIEVIGRKSTDLVTDIYADVYIGSPIHGAISAVKNGQKFGKPSYPMVFDPFPMMEKYQNKKLFQGWDRLLDDIRHTKTNVLTLCRSTHPYIHSWLKKSEDQLIPIYPCINSKVKKSVPKQKRGDYVLFISRLVPNKKLPHVLTACRDNKIDLKIIYPASGIKHMELIKEAKMQDKVELIPNASEYDKFRLIKGARAVINGAVYEGFGMWMAEALACGTPVVCYKYPTFIEIRNHAMAENVYMAEHNNPKSLAAALGECLAEAKYSDGTDLFNFEAMVERTKEVWQPLAG